MIIQKYHGKWLLWFQIFLQLLNSWRISTIAENSNREAVKFCTLQHNSSCKSSYFAPITRSMARESVNISYLTSRLPSSSHHWPLTSISWQRPLTSPYNCRTHSFDENLPKLGMRNMKRSSSASSASSRRVSWHSGLDTLDTLDTVDSLGGERDTHRQSQCQAQADVSVSPIVIISCPPASPPPPPPPSSQPANKERRAHSVTRNFRKIFNK